MKINYKKMAATFISAFSILIVCCFIMPSSAFALTSEEVASLAPSGAFYYCVEGNENDQWVLTNGKWEHCDIVDSSSNLNSVVAKIRKEMINRNTNISLYFATKADGYNDKLDPSASDYEAQKANLTVRNSAKIQKYITDNIYNRNLVTDKLEKAKSGSYLEMLTESIEFINTGRLQASDFSPYSYYRIEINLKYKTTAKMENDVDTFLAKWQKKFIDENSVIQNPALTVNEKNYYITKTIYNFLADNTLYDTNVNTGVVGKGTEQYTNSHSAYGALFGNTTNSSGVLDISKYNWSTTTDSMGLCKISKTNQGLSVCDGYSLVAYYLCQLNGIDCKIVHGDYTAGQKSDPHAWNIVKLCESTSSEYNTSSGKWYYFDATFAATSATAVKLNSLSIIDYSYFLRGTSNKAFDAQSHQQLTTAVSGLDSVDYYFKSNSIDCSKAWSVLTRRKSESNYLEIENYFLISPENEYYKINPDTYALEKCDNNVVYDGNAYYYNINIQDFVNGVEYTCSDQYLKDAQSCCFTAKSIDGSRNLYNLNFNISTLNMSNWDGYKHFIWGNGVTSTDLINADLSKSARIEFRGTTISFSVEIYDVAGQKLTENVNYTISYKNENGQPAVPCAPGSYYIEINFDINTNDNYSQILKIPFVIEKGNFGQFNIGTINASYGSDILSGCSSLELVNAGITLQAGIDYSTAILDPSRVNYGDEGTIIYTALPTSNYLIAGTSLYRGYKISKQCDISSIFNGTSTNSSYGYTGGEVKPDNFIMGLTNPDGSIYILRPNVDYVITSYSNNVNIGTGYVTVNFIGNYCGSATMSFEIAASGATAGNSSPSSPNTSGSASVANGTGNIQNATITPTAITGGKSKTTSKSVTICWNGQGNHFCYEIYTYDIGKKKWVLMAITTDNSFKVTFAVKNNKKSKFKANTVYKYKVRAFCNYIINGTEYISYSDFKQINAVTKVTTPKSPKIKKGKKSFKASWKKVTNASGYEIQYATDKKFKKNKKTYTVKKGKATSATVKKLKSRKTYYVRVRAYQTVNGKKVYSGYTKVLKVKVN